MTMRTLEKYYEELTVANVYVDYLGGTVTEFDATL